MTFSNDTKPTAVLRLARHSVLVWVLATPVLGVAALNSPQRPADSFPAKSTASTSTAPERTPAPKPYRGPRTYLAMVGPASLRFAEAEAVLPPEPSLPPPPKPKPTDTHSTASANNGDKNNITQPTPNGTDTNVEPTPTGNTPKPISILPDDTKHEIRAEDVLPFFQFPGATDSSSAAISISLPQQQGSTAPPPSSATYRQQ